MELYHIVKYAHYQEGNYNFYTHYVGQQSEKLPLSLASSTSRISTSRCLGERLMTLCTVRKRVLQASLWKTITTLVLGRSSGYTFVLHLSEKRKINVLLPTDEEKLLDESFTLIWYLPIINNILGFKQDYQIQNHRDPYLEGNFANNTYSRTCSGWHNHVILINNKEQKSKQCKY